MLHQPELLPDQPTPERAARNTERAWCLERLREKLKDPDFRAIEGFPIGEGEDIRRPIDPGDRLDVVSTGYDWQQNAAAWSR